MSFVTNRRRGQKKFRPVDKIKPFDISQSWTGLDGMSAANECLNEMKATRQKKFRPGDKIKKFFYFGIRDGT